MDVQEQEFRLMDAVSLEETVVNAVRHSLTGSQTQHAYLKRASRIARAAQVALTLAAEATANLNGDGYSVATVGALRRELVDAVRSVRLPEHGQSGPQLAAGLRCGSWGESVGGEMSDLVADHRRLQESMLNCALEWERATGLRVPHGDLVEFFLSGADTKHFVQSPCEDGANRTRLASMGICIPGSAWAVTLAALVGFLVYLSLSFLESKSNPIAHVELRRHEALTLPVITICPGLPGVPLFPSSPWPLAAVTRIEAPSRSSDLAPYLSHENMSKLVEQSFLIPHDPDGSETVNEEARCSPHMTAISSTRLRGSFERSFVKPCIPCFRLKPAFRLYSLPRGREKVKVTIALNRIALFCIFPRQRSLSESVMATFGRAFASEIQKLRDSRFLGDPTGQGNLANATSTAARSLFNRLPVSNNIGHGSSRTSMMRRFKWQTDLMCNGIFLTGFWYPLAKGSPRPDEIGFDWDPGVGYWQRRFPNSSNYWDVEKSSTEQLDKNPSSYSARAEWSLFTGGHWTVFAQGRSTVAKGMGRPSLVGVADYESTMTLRLRQSRDPQGHRSVTATARLTSPTILDPIEQSLYHYSILEFSFDRFLTEDYEERGGWYSTAQFAVDCANMISLFAGTSVYTLIVSPLLLYIHMRRKKKHSSIANLTSVQI